MKGGRRGKSYSQSDLSPQMVRDFYEFVTVKGSCWIWRGPKGSDGYGALRCTQGEDVRYVKAHRVSHVLHTGDLKHGDWVLHKCNIRRCVNPDHLYIGGGHENSSDFHRVKREFEEKKQQALGKWGDVQKDD